MIGASSEAALAAPPGGRVRRGPVRATIVGVAFGIGVLSCASTIKATGAFPAGDLPGLTQLEALPQWASALLRVMSTMLSVAVVGFALGAAVLDPGPGVRLSRYGGAWLRWTRWAAAGWVLVTLLRLPVRVAATVNTPLSAISPISAVNFALQTEEGRGLLATAALALTAAVGAELVATVRGAYVVLVLALLAVMPPALTGHAASAGSHQLATSSVLLHVVAVIVWSGGLLALFSAWRMGAAALAVVAARFSKIAGWCLPVVGLSGALSATTRLNGIPDLVGTTYGRVLLLKIGCLIVLAAAGWWHRRRTLRALATGRAAAFVRLVGCELAVLAATTGLGVALANTPTPPTADTVSATEELLGFPMPTALSVQNLLQPYPDLIYPSVAGVAVGLYVAGTRRLRSRGVRWPVTRTAAWIGGWALVLLVTSSGLARYGAVLTSVHMVQHMTLSMLAPVLLVLGMPLTLALRAFRPGTDGARGPREWLARGLRSRTVRVLTHPVVALATYVVSLYGTYMSGLYELALRSHVAHLLMFAHFLGIGTLFFWVVVGADPGPRRPSYPVRVLMLLLWVALHTVFALSIMQSQTVLASDWFSALDRTWGSSSLEDQRTAGGIAWGFGDVPLIIIVGALVLQWIRSDEKEQASIDRVAQRAVSKGRPHDDPHLRYNDFLKSLHEQDVQRAGKNPVIARDSGSIDGRSATDRHG